LLIPLLSQLHSILELYEVSKLKSPWGREPKKKTEGYSFGYCNKV
jgi:hypothetical protein